MDREPNEKIKKKKDRITLFEGMTPVSLATLLYGETPAVVQDLQMQMVLQR
jgi:hypothetical protein